MGPKGMGAGWKFWWVGGSSTVLFSVVSGRFSQLSPQRNRALCYCWQPAGAWLRTDLFAKQEETSTLKKSTSWGSCHGLSVTGVNHSQWPNAGNRKRQTLWQNVQLHPCEKAPNQIKSLHVKNGFKIVALILIFECHKEAKRFLLK